MKKLLFILFCVFLFSCNTKKQTYRVQIKLSDGSWGGIYLIEADSVPNFRIDCYNVDCALTGLNYNFNGQRVRLERPAVIDYKVLPKNK